MNRATQWQDERAIKTLGPYARVLYQTLWYPPTTNMEVMKKMATGEGWSARVRLYRGLGLPEKAIQVYHAYRESGDRFFFTGFTSTSCVKEIAMQFAHQATQRKGLVPVLFVMDTYHYQGKDKAFLHDESLTAFPGEKEYLLGDVSWKVQDIKKEILKFRDQPFEVIVIYMNN